MPSCSECVHNKKCIVYISAIKTKNSFDAEFEEQGNKLPMVAENLAMSCPDFLKPSFGEGILPNPEGV